MKSTELSFSLVLKRSRWMVAYVMLLYSGLIVGLWYLPLPTAWQWLALLLLLVCCYRSCRARMSLAVDFLQYRQGSWGIIRGGVSVPIELRGLTVWPWLIVLNYRLEQCRWEQSLVLFDDSARPDSLRQLRVILRHLPL